MVYDSRSEALWLHGCEGVPDGDLMRLDLQSLQWNGSSLTGTTQPSARRSHAMVYDSSRHVIWLHGGYTHGVFHADLWQLELASVTLRHVTATGPAERASSQMVYDSRNDVLWLHGGNGHTYLNLLGGSYNRSPPKY